jgi:acetyl-CoA synthetase
LQGQRQALEALDLAGGVGVAWRHGADVELRRPRALKERARALTEHDAKAALAAYGVRVPRSAVVRARDAAGAAEALGFPVVVKAMSPDLEHKSEADGVVLDVRSPSEAAQAAQRLARLSDSLLIEEMVTDGVAEVLVGVMVDPQFGQLLVLGAGGVLAELLRDSVTLLPPFDAPSVEAALAGLRVAKLLRGFRGRPAGDVPALVQTALACARYAEANLETLAELDVNPVIVRPASLGAVAVDALIRLAE